jgi:hypothetical protein
MIQAKKDLMLTVHRRLSGVAPLADFTSAPALARCLR